MARASGAVISGSNLEANSLENIRDNNKMTPHIVFHLIELPVNNNSFGIP